MIGLNFFIVLFSLVGNIFIGIFTFIKNQKSATNRIFLLFTISIASYLMLNYLSLIQTEDTSFLFYVRLVMSMALIINLLFFLFTEAFPSDFLTLSRNKILISILVTILLSLITQTNFVFSSVKKGVKEPIPGVGMPLFLIHTLFFLGAGFVVLIKKYISSKDIQKKQLKIFIIGSILMFFFILLTNLILVIIFKNPNFVSLLPIYTLIFVGFISYAIVKHSFLNVKVIGTEIFTFILLTFAFFEVILSANVNEIIFRLAIFVTLLIFGIFLIQSVIREVKQREKLEQLTSRLEEANKRLMELDNLKDEFVSVASHELRTPMTAIKSYLWMALHKSPSPLDSTLKKYLDIAYSSTERLLRLVADMLTVSRIEGKRLELKKEKINIFDLAKQIYEELKITADLHKINFNLEDPGRLPYVLVDKDRIREVFQNLIGNALKFTPENGQIKINFKMEENFINTMVSDTGTGIPPGEQAKLFQKFERLNNVAPQKINVTGTGLGLYICKQIVSLHQGRIWVNSKIGEGSTFGFSLPIVTNIT